MKTPCREYEEFAKRPPLPGTQQQANLPLVAEKDARGKIAEYYELFRSHFGRPEVPGILKCFATHPPLLAHMMKLSIELIFADGALTRRQKEMIATLLSSLNGCAYCADSHGFFLSQHGGTEQMVCALLNHDLDAAGLEGKERRLLEFAQKVNQNSASIGLEEMHTLRQVGWSEQQIAESIHVSALFAFFNRVANAFGLEPQGLLSTAKDNGSAAAASGATQHTQKGPVEND